MAAKFHRLTIDLEVPVYKRLHALASQEERSASKQGKLLIIKGLEEAEKAKKHPTTKV